MRRLPPLNALRAFEAAARLASVTAASKELGVSHSAVSQQLRQLEDYFGQKLFDRPGRRIEPTPAARALLEDIRAAFDRVAVASEQLTRRGMRRILTVSTTPSFAMHWLIPRIAAFQREHPSYELRVDTSASGCVSHIDKPYDLVIRREHMARSGHVCRPFLDDAATPVMHPCLRERRRLDQPARLTDLVLLHARSRPDAWPRWLLAHGAPPAETLDGPYFDTTALALHAALNGLGAAVAPLAFVSEDLAEGRLFAPFPERLIAGPGFHLLYRESAARDRGSRELLRWLEAKTGAALIDEPARTRGS